MRAKSNVASVTALATALVTAPLTALVAVPALLGSFIAGCGSSPPPLKQAKESITSQSDAPAAATPAATTPSANPACRAAPSRLASRLARVEKVPRAKIGRVLFRGAGHQSEAKLRSVIRTAAGQWLDAQKINSDIARLDALGVYEIIDVSVSRTRNAADVVFKLREFKLTHEVFFDGAPPSEKFDPAAQLNLTKDTPLGPELVDKAESTLRDLYARHGFQKPEIQIRLSPIDDDHTDVCIIVKQAAKLIVDTIAFTGINSVGAEELRALVNTDSGAVNTPGTPYREDLLLADSVKWRALYYDRGMLDVDISAPSSERAADGPRVRVVIEIKEGPVYEISNVRFIGKLVADASKYKTVVASKSGVPFNRHQLMDDVKKVETFHREMSRTGLTVTADTVVHRDSQSVEVTFRVD